MIAMPDAHLMQELKVLDCSCARARDHSAWQLVAAAHGVRLQTAGLETDDMFDSDTDNDT